MVKKRMLGLATWRCPAADDWISGETGACSRFLVVAELGGSPSERGWTLEMADCGAGDWLKKNLARPEGVHRWLSRSVDYRLPPLSNSCCYYGACEIQLMGYSTEGCCFTNIF